MTDSQNLAQTRQERIDDLHRSVADRTALLVVDMQYGFLHPDASLFVPAGRKIIGSVALMIEACRNHSVPVIFTEFVYATAVPCLRGDPFGPEHLPAVPGQPTGYGYPSSNCLIGPDAGQGAESAETIAELKPREEELVVRAHGYDKFYGTPLDLALRSRGIDRLLVTGVTTDVCVNSTVLAAANRNYRVTVITDGVATLDDSIQEACFQIWQRKFARLRSSEQIVAELAGM
ncbi:MAG: cysteine hydrolase [Planctomycetaceae bacterium]|nr:MAG: cysteine hydrolase [Planctomycetaceae bacterium]